MNMDSTTLLISINDLNRYATSIFLAIAVLVFLVQRSLAVRMDRREPPLVKPWIPYIGHMISLVKDPTTYLQSFSKKSVYTMTGFKKKLYVITDLALIQDAFRSKLLTIDPYMEEFGSKILDLDDEAKAHFRLPEDHLAPSLTRELVFEIKASMTGQELRKSNAQALKHIASTFNSIGQVCEISNLYKWLRSTLTSATSMALWGSHSPTIEDPSLIDKLWIFDNATLGLLARLSPFLVSSEGAKARDVWKSALRKYYNAHYYQDPDTSSMVKAFVKCFRKWNVSYDHIGDIELELIRVSTTNAIPTLFWAFQWIYQDSSLVKDIQKEIKTVMKLGSDRTDGKRELLIDITKFEQNCPLFVSAYRESMRLSNQQLGFRRVWDDTTISDGHQEYFLTKGAEVILPAGVTHVSSAIWGQNALQFDARRFITNANATENEKQTEKERRKAYHPFGGGRHLCPGRNFAFAEILGTLSILLLGFEVKNKEGGPLKVPAVRTSVIGEAVKKPKENDPNLRVRMERRAGWEDVVWKFVA